MAFHYNFRQIKSRSALIQALGINEAQFDAVLEFVGPAISLSVEAQMAAAATVPLFVRHDIPKKNKTRGFRTVWEPILCKDDYKALARRLGSFFRLTFASFPHECAYGFRSGKNIRENADVHKGRRALLCVDIKGFFPSISSKRVGELFETLGICTEVADLLARFVTINGTLPLGLPTSPVISNAIALPLDVALQALAAKSQARYSRYADDLSFSSDGENPSLEDVTATLAAHDFELAHEKTRRSIRGQAHFVTGLSVSDPVRPHVPRKTKRSLRQELYYAGKYGAADHFSRNTDNGLSLQEEVNRLDGLVKFVAHHEPQQGSRLRKQWSAITQQNGIRRSFAPKGQQRPPFYITVDEAEFTRSGDKILAVALCVSQHGPQIALESGEVFDAALDDLWADGDREVLEKRGLHFTDATEDLKKAYATRLASLPFQGYVAFTTLNSAKEYEKVYLELLDAMLERRLMAAESEAAFFIVEKNDKVSQAAIESRIRAAYDRLEARNDRRPRAMAAKFVSKPDLRISTPDFFAGHFGKVSAIKANAPWKARAARTIDVRKIERQVSSYSRCFPWDRVLKTKPDQAMGSRMIGVDHQPRPSYQKQLAPHRHCL